MLVATPLALKMVFRRFDPEAGSCAFGTGGGGGTVNNARSCVSVSRMSAVISCCCRSAFVNILGGGNLGAFRGNQRAYIDVDLRQLRDGLRAERDLVQMRLEKGHTGSTA
jgi:hypothetical protein